MGVVHTKEIFDPIKRMRYSYRLSYLAVMKLKLYGLGHRDRDVLGECALKPESRSNSLARVTQYIQRTWELGI
jgi:hypothetical protein